MNDIHSGNLINLVITRTNASGGPKVTLTGLPQWLHADSYSLVVLLDHLVQRLSEVTGVKNFDMSAEAGSPWVYVDISWEGSPVASSVIEQRWTDQPLPDALGGLTVSDVLQHHRSELWCENTQPGHARMRVPVPPSRAASRAYRPRRPFRPPGFLRLLPASPADRHGGTEPTPLDRLSFVVFDTETTGLRPSDGDEMIQITGVRIVNGRILTAETFSQLAIPAARSRRSRSSSTASPTIWCWTSRRLPSSCRCSTPSSPDRSWLPTMPPST